MHYYKHDHHMGMHPKWRGIAADLGIRPLDVYAIWNLLLEHASRHPERGSVAQFRAGDIAAQYDLEKSEVEAVLTEFQARGMIAEDRIAKWAWYQRDLSTARVQKHRAERGAAEESACSPSGDDPAPESAQRAETEMKHNETDMKRGETLETQKNKNENKSPPPYPPAEGCQRRQGTGALPMKDGTSADAGAGSSLSDAELKKRKHDVVIQRVITEAACTMPPEQCDKFIVALCDPRPPRWVCEERDRMWRQIKQERNARVAQRAPRDAAVHGSRAHLALNSQCQS